MNVSYCPNCGNKFGCSCSGGSSKITASDGSIACSKCVNAYEELLALKNIKSSNEAKKSK